MSHIFICYAGEDKMFAIGICDGLASRGVKTWIDVFNRNKEKRWDADVEENIKLASAVIFISSPDSLKDNCFARDELAFAHENNIKIIVIRYLTNEVPVTVARETVIDYFKKDDSKQKVSFTELLDRICEELKQFAPEKSSEGLPKQVLEYRDLASKYLADGRPDWALNAIVIAVRICPVEYKDVLGDILFLRNLIEDELQNKRAKEEAVAEKRALNSDLTDLDNWAFYGERGSQNWFYGIAMYALALENDGQHFAAVNQLRRACKLEPRVKNRLWMTKNHGWTEEYHRLLEAILLDMS